MDKSKFTVALLARSLRFITGGTRRRIEIANRLARRGWKVTMYTFEADGISPRWKPLELEVPLKKRVDRIEADFVICGDLFEDRLETKQGTFLTAKAKIKKIWLMQIYNRKQNIVLTNHHIVKVANSGHTMDLAKDRFGQDPWPAIGGVDTKFFHPQPEPKSFNISTYNRKNRIKGAGNLNNLQPIDNSQSQVELRQRYWNSTIFLSLEYGDFFGWCNPVAEAMACGRACIAIDSPHVRDLIIDGKMGLLAKPDLNDIRSKIERLKDPNLRKRFVKAGLEHIKKFDWKKVVDSLEKFML